MNPLRTILLALDASSRGARHIRFARELAERFDAELVAMPVLEPRFIPLPMPAPDGLPTAPLLDEVDPEQLRRARAVFEVNGRGLRWEEPGPRAGNDAFCRRALYADWLIIGQHDASDPGMRDVRSDFPETAIIASGRPALVLPHRGALPSAIDTVVVGWRASREAGRALTAALPLLQAAKRVQVLGGGVDLAGGQLQAYLASHGVRAGFEEFEPPDPAAGERLLARAGELGADLLVMGCYGHSRAREWVLGGATRHVLRAMHLPVLMAH
jgi:nucleotide-binding universal stress UspA family protein